MENATRGIVLLCLMVIPWIISSHLIAHKYNLSQQNEKYTIRKSHHHTYRLFNFIKNKKF